MYLIFLPGRLDSPKGFLCVTRVGFRQSHTPFRSSKSGRYRLIIEKKNFFAYTFCWWEIRYKNKYTYNRRQYSHFSFTFPFFHQFLLFRFLTIYNQYIFYQIDEFYYDIIITLHIKKVTKNVIKNTHISVQFLRHPEAKTPLPLVSTCLVWSYHRWSPFFESEQNNRYLDYKYETNVCVLRKRRKQLFSNLL